MSGRTWRGLIAGLGAGLLAGCGGEETGGEATSAAGPGSSGKQVHLVGFDAVEPLVKGLARREIEGVVVQNPFRMGELGVKTLVQHLEKQPVELKVSTGETMVTPENMNDPRSSRCSTRPRPRT
jgi:ribose transport system substrate-binding protein